MYNFYYVLIHKVLWEENYQDQDWVFLLIDARNAFNEENQTAMIWAVHHKWPNGAHFTFNCYRHWATLVVMDGEISVVQHVIRVEEVWEIGPRV